MISNVLSVSIRPFSLCSVGNIFRLSSLFSFMGWEVFNSGDYYRNYAIVSFLYCVCLAQVVLATFLVRQFYIRPFSFTTLSPNSDLYNFFLSVVTNVIFLNVISMTPRHSGCWIILYVRVLWVRWPFPMCRFWLFLGRFYWLLLGMCRIVTPCVWVSVLWSMPVLYLWVVLPLDIMIISPMVGIDIYLATSF